MLNFEGFHSNISRVLASKWKYLPDQRECPDLNRSTGELVQIKISQLSLNILRVWTVLKFFKCPTKQKTEKSALFIPFCLCICIWEVSFWKISDEGFGRHHFRAHVSGNETFCHRKWFKILNLIRSYRVFWTPTKWLSNFQIQYSKTVQNTSVTILDHQKSIIAIFLSYFLETVKNSYFPKT